MVARTDGYTLTIKALDQASDQIKRISKAFEDLKKQDSANDNTAGANQQRKKFQELSSGVTTFGKQSKTALTEIGKLFDITSSKIGKTIGVLESSFKLGGLAVGATLGAKAIDAIASSMTRAGREAQKLRDAAANIFGKEPGAAERLQRAQALYGLYGIAPEATTDSLQKIAEMKLKAARNEQTPLGLVAGLPGSGIDVAKDAPDVIQKKLIDLELKGFFDKFRRDQNSVQGQGVRELFTSIFGNEDLTRIKNRPDALKFWEDANKIAAGVSVQSEKTTTALGKVADSANELSVRFTSLINAIQNKFIEPLAAAVTPLTDKLKELLEYAEKNPGMALGGAAAGGLGALYLIKKAGESFLGWVGKSMGFAQNVNPTEVAKGIGMLAWLGKVASVFGLVGGLTGSSGPGEKNWGTMTPEERNDWLKSQGRPPMPKSGSSLGGLWNWFSGNRDSGGTIHVGGGAAGAGGKAGGTHVPDIAGMTPDEKNFLGLVLQHESMGGQNVMNYMGKALGISPTAEKGFTAQGYYQMLNSNWNRLAPKLGITTKNAMASTLEDQTKVALALLREGGKGHWTKWNWRLAAAVARGDKSPLASKVPEMPPAAPSIPGSPVFSSPIPPATRSAFPPGTKYNSKGQPYSDTPAEDVPKVEQSMKAIQDSMKSGKPWFTSPEKEPEPLMPEKPKPELSPQTSNESSHKVEFTILNAPTGSRSRIVESSGSSELNLRTRYAMGVV